MRATIESEVCKGMTEAMPSLSAGKREPLSQKTELLIERPRAVAAIVRFVECRDGTDWSGLIS